MFITFYFNIGYRNRVLKKPASLSLAAITTEPCSIFTANAVMIYEKSIFVFEIYPQKCPRKTEFESVRFLVEINAKLISSQEGGIFFMQVLYLVIYS